MKQQTATIFRNVGEGAKSALQNTKYFFRGLLTTGHPLVQIAYDRLMRGGISERLQAKYAERIVVCAARSLIHTDEKGRDTAVKMMLDVLTGFHTPWVCAKAQRAFTHALATSEADLIRVLSYGRVNDDECRKILLDEGIWLYRKMEKRLKGGKKDARTLAIINACPIDNEDNDSMRAVLFYHLTASTELKHDETFRITELFVEIGRGLPKHDEWLRHLIEIDKHGCGGSAFGVKTRELLENALKEIEIGGDRDMKDAEKSSVPKASYLQNSPL